MRQALVKKFPLISAESIQVGAAWGEQMSNQIGQEIQASKEKSLIHLLLDVQILKLEILNISIVKII